MEGFLLYAVLWWGDVVDVYVARAIFVRLS